MGLLRKPRGSHIVISFLFFTFPVLLLLFDFHFAIWLFCWDFGFYFLLFPFRFSLLHFAFRLRFRFLLFYFSVSVSNFFLFYRFISFYFSLFVLAFKLYNENQKTKNQNQNQQSRPSRFAGRSIWLIMVSIRRSAALLTMLAQVNFLILPPLSALNHKLYFFSTWLLILLFKLWKSR